MYAHRFAACLTKIGSGATCRVNCSLAGVVRGPDAAQHHLRRLGAERLEQACGHDHAVFHRQAGHFAAAELLVDVFARVERAGLEHG